MSRYSIEEIQSFEKDEMLCKLQNDLERYKEAYGMFMDYFDYLPDEDKPKLHKRLDKIGL